MTVRQGIYLPLKEKFGIKARNAIEINNKNKNISSKKEFDTTCVN